ncbi:ABC transporter permease subunit [Dermatophilus congolensis]|uniref:ABC transporter permease subunit n=1 Tax=Dermatophilus congolensis TaxID=1863 RepID=UPI001AAFD907|nr:ABC transporter permease [Dermatophilus congolensis]MBO3150973.1 ABC transporter permease [Dermatophilus congolensis]MBO3162022.1 ABC transporter permease [Dermatophilus congolensis]MBO3162257.1 ABC transporter permease [Dermatophilus congolensis]MBO3175812.1 ABC transporter permease [Dermatophilus congolensis]
MSAETATSTPAPSRGKTLSTWLSNNGAIVGLALVCLIMFIATPAFLTIPNLLNVGVQAAVTAVIAFGMTYVIVTAGIDLSVGSIAALSAIGAGWMVTTGAMPGPLALILAPLMGLIAGSVTGTAVAYGKLPAFIATLAMLSIARGLALVISEGRPILMPDAVNWLGSNLGPIPVPILVLLLAWAVTAFILNRTVFGRSLYAIGGNEEAARLTGLPVKRTLASVYALSGLYSGIAGLLLAGRLASAQPQAATGYELDAIAAVVIGGASLTGGSGKATGTLIGALVLAVIRNGLNLLSVTAFWQQVVIGLVIAAAVGIDVLRNRK